MTRSRLIAHGRVLDQADLVVTNVTKYVSEPHGPGRDSRDVNRRRCDNDQHMDSQRVSAPHSRTLRQLLTGRPWWINLLWVFCLYMTFIYVPFDVFFKPMAQDQEVWFGVVLSGFWAKATEPLHWLIYALGAWGFWRMRAWMWPWAAAYAAQVAIGMLVWNLREARGGGWLAGVIAALIILLPTVALWRAKPLLVGR